MISRMRMFNNISNSSHSKNRLVKALKLNPVKVLPPSPTHYETPPLEAKTKKFKKNSKNARPCRSSSILEKLKSLEKRTIHKHRKIYDYSTNFSAALALPVADDQIEASKKNKFSLLKESEPLILEHAARRVDLFFYTLIAYYNTNHILAQGHTELQHGRGRGDFENTKFTQACHSSFFPSLIDDSIEKQQAHNKSVLSGTHFMESLNSTVELPWYVNKFDDELEIKYQCRLKSLEIIRAVSAGEKNPVEGLTQFLQIMDTTFRHLEESIVKEKEAKDQLKNELLILIKQGTFVNKWDSESQIVNKDYISMLLRLKPQEIKAGYKNKNSITQIYKNKILEIQKEIISTQSSHHHDQPMTSEEKCSKSSR